MKKNSRKNTKSNSTPQPAPAAVATPAQPVAIDPIQVNLEKLGVRFGDSIVLRVSKGTPAEESRKALLDIRKVLDLYGLSSIPVFLITEDFQLVVASPIIALQPR